MTYNYHFDYNVEHNKCTVIAYDDEDNELTYKAMKTEKGWKWLMDDSRIKTPSVIIVNNKYLENAFEEWFERVVKLINDIEFLNLTHNELKVIKGELL